MSIHLIPRCHCCCPIAITALADHPLHCTNDNHFSFLTRVPLRLSSYLFICYYFLFFPSLSLSLSLCVCPFSEFLVHFYSLFKSAHTHTQCSHMISAETPPIRKMWMNVCVCARKNRMFSHCENHLIIQYLYIFTIFYISIWFQRLRMCVCVCISFCIMNTFCNRKKILYVCVCMCMCLFGVYTLYCIRME